MGSHDFIRFPPKLGEFSPKTWMLMGEIQAKIENLGQVPIPPSRKDELRTIYLAKGVQGTTAIEGNTLSSEEVERAVRGDLVLPPSRAYLAQEVNNILAALECIERAVIRGDSEDFSLMLLNNYHRSILAKLDEILEEGVLVGELRTHNVTVGRYRALPWQHCEQKVQEYCHWLNSAKTVPDTFEHYALAWEVIKALVAHLYFAWIHPYGDGNGRMARMIEFDLLLRAGVPYVAAHLLSNFYYKTVVRYRRELQASHGNAVDGSYPEYGSLQGFLEYALEGLRDELTEQSLIIYNFVLGSVWQDHVRNQFRSEFAEGSNKVRARQERLALDMTDPRFQTPVAFGDIRRVKPEIAIEYPEEKSRTLRRDLEKLVELDLLVKTDNRYGLNRDILVKMIANMREDGG